MSELEDEYRLDYFEENGFHRMECSECGDAFWTRDGDRETPPCDSYGFIDDPGFDEQHTLAEMREAFLSFFEQHPFSSNMTTSGSTRTRWRRTAGATTCC